VASGNVGQCPDALEKVQNAGFSIGVKNLARFKSMDEARWWSIANNRKIDCQDCPMHNYQNSTHEDLLMCGIVCKDRWACMTYTNIFSDEVVAYA
jgi:hypothetical protein